MVTSTKIPASSEKRMMKDNYFSWNMGFPKDKRQEIFFLLSALIWRKSKCNHELFVVGINIVIIDVLCGLTDKDFKFKNKVTITQINAHKVALHSNKELCIKREKCYQFSPFHKKYTASTLSSNKWGHFAAWMIN